jgi:hypothetical protein
MGQLHFNSLKPCAAFKLWVIWIRLAQPRLDDGEEQAAHQVVGLLQHHVVVEVRPLSRACVGWVICF